MSLKQAVMAVNINVCYADRNITSLFYLFDLFLFEKGQHNFLKHILFYVETKLSL